MFETRTFDLHILCANCQRPSTKAVTVPAHGGPYDEDEFIEQLEYRPVPFHCPHCDSNIAELVGINLRRAESAAAA